MPSSINDFYANRIEVATGQRDHLHKQWSLFGNLRLLAALVTIIGLWQAVREPALLWAVVLLAGFAAFLVLAVQQRRLGKLRAEVDRLVAVNQRALARFEHSWAELPMPPDSGADRTHAYAHDLNIVGEASVAKRIGTPATDHGWRALYAALLQDRDLTDNLDRQAAIQELAGKIDRRQAIESEVVGTESIPDSSPLLIWARGKNWLSERGWLRILALVGPALVLLVAILVWSGVVLWPMLLVPLTLNSIVFSLAGRTAAEDVQSIVPMREAVASYGRIMQTIAHDAPASPMLCDLNTRLGGAAAAMRSLARITNFSLPQGSMLYYPLQMTLMWDINVLDRLENWRGEHGDQVAGWLDAMGEWESLAALSVLAHDNPEWAMPIIGDCAGGIISRQVAHPLLPADIAVANDVEITPAGKFLFVTGSNMSGKSTLLRAIGVNAVLAQAGSSVCADRFAMPPLRISSCMRVEDSLAHGVSFFMAELLRLKSVVDTVQQSDTRMALYLLDEILQGTNTAERQIASRHILQQLSTMNAIGAVSSHDLELIEGTDLESAAVSVHFAEQFSRIDGEPEMTFDYRLKPGVATSSNAIRLMELIGFEIHE